MYHSKRALAVLLLGLCLLTGCARSGGEKSDSPWEPESQIVSQAAHQDESLSLPEASGAPEPESREESFHSEDSSDLTEEPWEPAGSSESDTPAPDPASSAPDAPVPGRAGASSGSSAPASSPAPDPAGETAGSQTAYQADGGTVLGGETGSGNAGTSGSGAYLSAVEQEVASLINAHRGELGLSRLEVHGSLTSAARVRSRELWDHSYFAHTRPDGSGWQTVLQVEVPLAYRQAGENLAMVEHNMRDRDPASEAAYWFGVWRDSPGHYANMIKPEFTHIGLGIYRTEEDGMVHAYATTLFAAI